MISDLKLRASWGETGQQDGIAFYSYLPRYSAGTESAQYLFGDNYLSFLRPQAYDRDVRWESTQTINLGLDFSLWGNRVSGSVDVYKKNTTDLLSVIPIAAGPLGIEPVRISCRLGSEPTPATGSPFSLRADSALMRAEL